MAKAVGPLRQQLSEAKTNAAADAKAAKLAAAAREAAAKKEGEALVGRLVELLYFATVGCVCRGCGTSWAFTPGLEGLR